MLRSNPDSPLHADERNRSLERPRFIRSPCVSLLDDLAKTGHLAQHGGDGVLLIEHWYQHGEGLFLRFGVIRGGVHRFVILD